jgi:hypothetical protein
LSSDKRNVFAKRKLQRTVVPPLAVNARNRQRKRKRRTKIETVRIEGTASANEIVTAVVITVRRRGKGTGIVTATVNGRETETMIVEGGSIIDEMITRTVIGPQGTIGTGIMVIGRRNITKITTGMTGGGTANIGMRTVGMRVGARGIGRPRRNAMREVKR